MIYTLGHINHEFPKSERLTISCDGKVYKTVSEVDDVAGWVLCFMHDDDDRLIPNSLTRLKGKIEIDVDISDASLGYITFLESRQKEAQQRATAIRRWNEGKSSLGLPTKKTRRVSRIAREDQRVR